MGGGKEDLKKLELVGISFAFLGFARINFLLSNGMESNLKVDERHELYSLPTDFKYKNSIKTDPNQCKNPIVRVEMFFSSSRKGNPLTGLAFYDKFNRAILQLGK